MNGQPVGSSAPATPGGMLRAERLRQELTEKSVSEKLHITMHYVRSIEADLYEKLPGTVFARGYIRSYAILLGLDAGEIVARFDAFVGGEVEPQTSPVGRAEVSLQRQEKRVPWALLSLLAFILGFAGLWAANHWLLVLDEDSYLSGRPAMGEIAAGEAPTLSMDDAGAVAGSTATPPPLRILDSPVSHSVETGNRLIEVTTGGQDVLEIRFSGESWVEVSDETALPPYRDIREAGDILQITGDAPFQVLLGDAPYASLVLNGISIDLTDNIRIDNSARLVVGL